jgi:hypothetical protein
MGPAPLLFRTVREDYLGSDFSSGFFSELACSRVHSLTGVCQAMPVSLGSGSSFSN